MSRESSMEKAFESQIEEITKALGTEQQRQVEKVVKAMRQEKAKQEDEKGLAPCHCPSYNNNPCLCHKRVAPTYLMKRSDFDILAEDLPAVIKPKNRRPLFRRATACLTRPWRDYRRGKAMRRSMRPNPHRQDDGYDPDGESGADEGVQFTWRMETAFVQPQKEWGPEQRPNWRAKHILEIDDLWDMDWSQHLTDGDKVWKWQSGGVPSEKEGFHLLKYARSDDLFVKRPRW